MTDLRKAAEMALECLNYHWDYFEDESGDGLYVLEAKKALRQALAEPKHEWVGLTDEERRGIREWQEIQKELGPVWAPMMLYLYLAIEAKLKEKNT